MFTPRTEKLDILANIYPKRIEELDSIFSDKTNIYIDWSNVLGWQNRLGWHIDPKRLYQFLHSFSSVDTIKWYFGTLQGDEESERFLASIKAMGYDVKTKPVKIMYHSIDISSLNNEYSPDILKSYITKGLLQHLQRDSIRIFNWELQKLNALGILKIEEKNVTLMLN